MDDIKKEKTSKGFTIVEILTVLVIISILSAIILANYSTGQKELALTRAANKLAQDLARAKEMAMSIKDHKVGEDMPTPSHGGYGIFFDLDEPFHYILFADCNKNKIYDSNQKDKDRCYDAYNPETGSSFFYPELVEDIPLEKNVKISSLSPLSSENSLVITFRPPNPDVNFNPDDVSIATITLSIDGKQKKVNIYKSGLIFVEAEKETEFPSPPPSVSPPPSISPSPSVSPPLNLSCSLSNGSCSGTTVFKISDSFNAHAELPTQNNYNYYICCSGITGLENSCSGNYVIVLKLSAPTNAHVEKNNYSNYSNNACLSVSTGTVICNYSTNCSSDYTCLASISDETNAHVGACDAYSIKVCCKVQ